MQPFDQIGLWLLVLTVGTLLAIVATPLTTPLIIPSWVLVWSLVGFFWAAMA